MARTLHAEKGADERSVIRRRVRRDGHSSRRWPQELETTLSRCGEPRRQHANIATMAAGGLCILALECACRFVRTTASSDSACGAAGIQPRSRGRRRDRGASGRGGRPGPDVPPRGARRRTCGAPNSRTESSDVEHSGRQKREARSRDGDECAHLHLE